MNRLIRAGRPSRHPLLEAILWACATFVAIGALIVGALLLVDLFVRLVTP